MPHSQKKGGTPTPLQSRKAQATQSAMHTIREKLRLGPLAQQQAFQRAEAASSNLGSIPPICNNQPAAATPSCPSFDLNMSYHGDDQTNRDHATSLEPRNLHDYMSDSADEWGLDPKELQKACYAAEMAFEKKKEEQRLEMERLKNERQSNDQDARTPATVTTPTVDVASSSRTPAAVGHERRVVRAPAHLRSPYIDPENIDPFFCSKEVCAIYDAVCQYSTPTTWTRAKQTTDNRQEKPTPLLVLPYLFPACNLDLFYLLSFLSSMS